MKISGFTFVRNAELFCYPVIESLKSLLPLVDEIIIAVGKSEDGTLGLIQSLNEPKIKIIETVWDETLKKGGLIYSQQTNFALAECTGDWCFYLQADEVLHERDRELTLAEIAKADNNSKADALLFRYRHFYGSYDYIGAGRQWYRREIRAFRNIGNVVSWGDAQGFRKKTSKGFEKLNAIQTDIEVFHYGWVRPPKAQTKKLQIAANYYFEHSKSEIEKLSENEFDYDSAYELEKFEGNHPSIMNDKIEKDKEWTQFFDPNKLKPKPLRVKILDAIEKKTGWRIGEYRDFIEKKK